MRCHLGPYRGAGRPEAIYMIERLIDKAAQSMNIDPAELRLRNLIPASSMPYKTPNGPIYDSGEFEQILKKAQALAEWNSFPARRKVSERNGKLRGIGIGCFLEVAGGILDETVDLRFEPDGKVALRTGFRQWDRDIFRHSCHWWHRSSASTIGPCDSFRAIATKYRPVRQVLHRVRS